MRQRQRPRRPPGFESRLDEILACATLLTFLCSCQTHRQTHTGDIHFFIGATHLWRITQNVSQFDIGLPGSEHLSSGFSCLIMSHHVSLGLIGSYWLSPRLIRFLMSQQDSSCLIMSHYYIMSHHVLTCLTMSDHVLKCFIRFFTSHHVSSGLTMSYHVSSCLIASHQVLPMSHHVSSGFSCLIMSHYVSTCVIVSHHVSSYLIMSHYVSTCFIVSHHVSSYLIMSHYVSTCFIVSHHVSSGRVSSGPFNRSPSRRIISYILASLIILYFLSRHFPQSSRFFNPVKQLPHCRAFFHPSGPQVRTQNCNGMSHSSAGLAGHFRLCNQSQTLPSSKVFCFIRS